MSYGVYAYGAAVAYGAIDEADSAASFDPYAGVFDAPDQDQIVLIEIEVRRGDSE